MGTWTALLVMGSLVLILFGGAALASIEVTVKASGVLRQSDGLRTVQSVLGGSVTQVLAVAGARVVEGQVLARLEDTPLEATLAVREAEWRAVQQETQAASSADGALLDQVERALRRRARILGRRRSLSLEKLSSREERADNLRELVAVGAIDRGAWLEAREAVHQAREELLAIDSQRADTQLQRADRRRDWERREEQRRTLRSRAEAAVREARSLLEKVEVRSPATGRLESLLITPGAVIQAGQTLAQVVPGNAPRTIVAFLPSHEVAFVKVGSVARVEVQSLPVGEFGQAAARVTRISSETAKPEELAASFDAAVPGSFVRVELLLLPSDEQAAMEPHLRSGERVLVRLHRRKRRILGLLFDFARKWTGQ